MKIKLVRSFKNGKEHFAIEKFEILDREVDLEKLPADVKYGAINGILNTLVEAIRNAAMQTGSDKILIPYNPTHGFLADMLESGWDTAFGGLYPSGNARHVADTMATLKAQGRDFNWAAHSQGALILMTALNWLEEGLLEKRKNKPGVFQFQANGAPVSDAAFIRAVEGAGGKFTEHNKNYGDPVPTLVGRNAKDLKEFITAVKNIATLLDPDTSPHSSYKCIGKGFCDNK